MNREEVEIPLPGTRADVGAGRRFVRDTLEQWGHTEVAEDAALVASELITNVVLHARTRLEVIVRRNDDRIRIEVIDKNRNLPQLRRHSAQSGTGRGLHLVAAVAADWGAETRHDGKIVWVELAAQLESGRDVDATRRAAPVVDLDALEAAGGWDDVPEGPRALRVA